MQQRQIYDYYRFGYNYRLLRYPFVGWDVHGIGGLIEGLEEFLAYLDDLTLQVTAQASPEIAAILAEVRELPADATVDATLASRLTEICDKIDATLDAELKLRTAFIVTPKRLHIDHLLKSPSSLFGEGVFQALPLMSQFDFKEACRCIAFAMPTAAAFHCMRATEALLRQLYKAVIKRNRVEKLLWYPMVEHLRKRKNSVPKPLLDNLDNIRVNFRNPTSHPEARYDLDEAQDLMALSVDVTNRIAKRLREQKS